MISPQQVSGSGLKRCYIMLGKHGDQLSIAPVLQAEFAKTGARSAMVVSRDYTAVPDRLPGIHPVIYDGPWHDLTGAIKWAKERYDEVIVPQVYGQNFPIQHQTPSFQTDQWLRAGALEQWDTLPLAVGITQRDFAESGRKIVLADRSESNPFDPIEELAELLTKSFPDHMIVRLGNIRLDNPCDLLTLFNSSDAIVSVETMALHLAKASNVPIFALVTDKPSPWSGTAYSKRFELHIRYGDWEARKAELIEGVRAAVNKSPTKIAVERRPTLFPNGYNPSLIQFGGHSISTYRYHPLERQWRTRLALHSPTWGTFKIRMPKEIEDNSIEDGRLFTFDDKLWLSYTVGLYGQNNGYSPCVVGYGQITGCEKETDQWLVEKHFQPKFGHNDWSRQEKNWVFFEYDHRLFAAYETSPDHIVIEIRGNEVVAQWRTKTPGWAWGQMRGGTQAIQYQGKWLRFFHSRTGRGEKHYQFRYHIGALVMEPAPPFRIVAVSNRPIISGDEEYVPNCRHWKPSVCFPGGAIEVDGEFRLAFGKNDCQCCVARLKPEDLNL